MSNPMPGPDAQVSGPIAQSVERMRREFERWLDAALYQGNRALDAVGLRASDRLWTPSIDVAETAGEILVDVDLPGVEVDAVEVSLAGNMLTVQGPKRSATFPAGAVGHQMERMHGPFQRSIPMPAPVAADSVTAELKSGVLRLRLQKSEKARAMKIPVHVAPGASPRHRESP